MTEQQWANMTETELMKSIEYYHKWLAINSEEEVTRSGVRYANMTKEERRKRNKYKRKYQDMLIERYVRKRKACTKIPPAIKIEPLEKKSNPLETLIKKMISDRMGTYTIYTIHRNILAGILELIGIDCKLNKVFTYQTAIRNLKSNINVAHLIELLLRWEGWVLVDSFEYLVYDNLFTYLKSNALKFNSQIDEFLPNELSNLFNTGNFISVSCSFNQLQTLFYHNPHNYVKLDSEHIPLTKPFVQPPESPPEYIIIWPYVSTWITLPNFSMMHLNSHVDEFTLLNITTNELNADIKKRYSKNRKVYMEYKKSDVEIFLNQLRNALIDKVPGNVTIEKKAELILALTILENDLAQGPDVIVSNRFYDVCSVSHPYARYLGYADDGNVCITMSDQKAVKSSASNVRLRQIRHPNVAFILQDFNVAHEIKHKKPRYIFDELFLSVVDTCILYSCLLCDKGLKPSTSEMIQEHFSKYHGLEPDWECTKCLKSFTNNYLLNNDWKHECE